MPTPITLVTELTPHLGSLKALGYSTLEELIGAAAVAGPELERFLGVSLDALLSAVPFAAPTDDPEALATVQEAEYPLGVEIDYVPRPDEAPMIAAYAELPVSVNLVHTMPPIRDQEHRGTCVSFATLAVFEQAHGSSLDFSEQFLYAKCKELDGIPNRDGTFLGVAFPKALAASGVCLETTWPYNPLLDNGNFGQGPAPADATAEAASCKPSSTFALSPNSVYDMKSELAAGRCVAFSIPVFNSWYQNTAVRLSGDIVMPIPGEIRHGGHAMCLVGYEDLPSQPEIGGGRFILRNSWDSKWGVQSLHRPGYGTIPYAYIDRHCVEAYSLKK